MSGHTTIIQDDGSTGDDALAKRVAEAIKNPNEHGFMITVKRGQVLIFAFHRLQAFPTDAAKKIRDGLTMAIEAAEKTL